MALGLFGFGDNRGDGDQYHPSFRFPIKGNQVLAAICTGISNRLGHRRSPTRASWPENMKRHRWSVALRNNRFWAYVRHPNPFTGRALGLEGSLS